MNEEISQYYPLIIMLERLNLDKYWIFGHRYIFTGFHGTREIWFQYGKIPLIHAFSIYWQFYTVLKAEWSFKP